MTVWIKRSFDNQNDYRPVLDEFGKLWRSLSLPREMLLVAQGLWGNHTTLYMCLPEGKYIASFPGFEEIEAQLLPKEAFLLHGRKDAFDEKFIQTMN
jgi:hypothetical protein